LRLIFFGGFLPKNTLFRCKHYLETQSETSLCLILLFIQLGLDCKALNN